LVIAAAQEKRAGALAGTNAIAMEAIRAPRSKD
jgi:hypothetical protein